jgi:Mor family transcriptional regulator
MDTKESKMKRILTVAILTMVANSQIITIMDNGIKRKIYLPDNKTDILARSTNSNHPKKELIIAFKKGVNIEEFAKKYNLKLKTTVVKKYYIFKNRSNLDAGSLIAKIVVNESNIKTIRPNWGFGFKAR